MAQDHNKPGDKPNTRTIPGAPGKLHTPAATHPAKVATPAPAKK
jgi:hypothetical protein